MTAAYPSSVFIVTVHANGEQLQASHVNDCESELAAIEAGLLNGYAHTTFPLNDFSVSLGKPTNRFANLYTTALQALDVASRVNYLEIDAAAATSPVVLQAKGTDTAVDLSLRTKGGEALRLADTAAPVNFLRVSPKPT